jgi:signal transduction histidine kinase
MIIHSCTEIPDTQKKSLKAVCDRISDITNNLLRYTKPDHYSDALTGKNATSPTNVAHAITEIITEKRYEYTFRDIKITPKFNPNADIFINVDSQAFKRAMSNIINNAVDACENRAGEVVVSIATLDNKVLVTIEDNGKGMPESVREKILNHTPVTFGKANGHGIGYTQICDMLAKSNGTLQIQSRQNIGTKIMLTFLKSIVY